MHALSDCMQGSYLLDFFSNGGSGESMVARGEVYELYYV